MIERAGVLASITNRYIPASTQNKLFRARENTATAKEAAYRRWSSTVRALGLSLSCTIIATVSYDETPAQADVPLLKKG
jgi:hypothetical protein